MSHWAAQDSLADALQAEADLGQPEALLALQAEADLGQPEALLALHAEADLVQLALQEAFLASALSAQQALVQSAPQDLPASALDAEWDSHPPQPALAIGAVTRAAIARSARPRKRFLRNCIVYPPSNS